MSRNVDIKVAKLFSLTLYGRLTDQSCSVNRSPIRTVFCRHISTFLSRRSLSTFSNHVILGLPILLLPSGLLSNIFLTSLPWPSLTTCPIQSKLFFVTSATVGLLLQFLIGSYSPHSSFYIPISSSRFSFPAFNLFLPISVTGYVSILHVTTFDIQRTVHCDIFL